MTDVRLQKLEDSLINLNDKFSEFIAIESARKERDKQQIEINKEVLSHMKAYRENDKVVIDRVRKWQGWFDDFIGKKVLPLFFGLLFIAVLSAAGYGIIIR